MRDRNQLWSTSHTSFRRKSREALRKSSQTLTNIETSIPIVQPKNLLLVWAIIAAAPKNAAGYAAEEQAILNDDLSFSRTHDQKTSLAKKKLKVSSDGQASGTPEIVKLAIDVSATSSVSQEEATERLGSSISQVELLLKDQQAANITDTYTGSSTHVSKAKDNPHWNRQFSEKEGGNDDDGSAEPIRFRAETFYNIRGAPGQAIEDIRSTMHKLREVSDVRIRGVEWEFSDAPRERGRMNAKKRALQKCFFHGEETAAMLGFTSTTLIEIEEPVGWVQEKRDMRQTVWYPANGEEIRYSTKGA